MYTIIGGDGREYGPVPFETVLQWIAARRADAASRIRPDGADWTTIGALPEFVDALRLPPPIPTASAPPPQSPAGGYAAASHHPTDPGPSALPEDVATRDYAVDFGGCISRAWALVTGPKMGTVIGGVAVWIAIQFGLSLFAQIPFIGLIFSLASFVIGGALTGGLYAFQLRCVRGQAAEIGHLFDGFRFCFAQLFLGNLIVGLITFATMIPGLAMVGGGVFMLVNEVATPAAIALVSVGAVAALVPAFYCAICWGMTLPLIIDKRLEFWPAMQLSRTVVRKHWWQVFGLVLVAGLISTAGLLVCGVGFFFSAPLGTAAFCYCYEQLFSEPTGRSAKASALISSPTL